MSPDIKHNSENAKDYFHRVFLWYLDEGISAPSRRQGIKELSEVLDIPERTIEMWVSSRTPRYWKLVLSTLEEKYGAPPKTNKYIQISISYSS
jgi:hypothetical protein